MSRHLLCTVCSAGRQASKQVQRLTPEVPEQQVVVCAICHQLVAVLLQGLTQRTSIRNNLHSTA